MDSYWDLYVAYVYKCVANNWANDIDPAHYEMEWNHFLPQCIFEDQPVGHWLTKRQHAIASALQTLAFRRNCMFGWHKHHLPDGLLRLAWPHFCSSSQKRLHGEKTSDGKSVRALKLCEKVHSGKNEEGKSLHTLKLCEKIHSKKDEQGRSLHGVKAAERLHAEKTKDGKSKTAVKAAVRLNEVTHSEKNEEGKSVHASRIGKISCEKQHKEKNSDGKSKHAVKMGIAAAKKLHEERDELGRSVAAMKTNSQKWKCKVTGKVSSPGPLTVWQKARGIDTSLRERVQ